MPEPRRLRRPLEPMSFGLNRQIPDIKAELSRGSLTMAQLGGPQAVTFLRSQGIIEPAFSLPTEERWKLRTSSQAVAKGLIVVEKKTKKTG